MKISGWTYAEGGPEIPRKEEVPSTFYSEQKRADSAAGSEVPPAWDEPGYVDPGETHFDEGTRYWQGFAKVSTDQTKNLPVADNPERAMSPEWVARVTENNRPAEIAEDLEDAQWPKVVREKSRDFRSQIWPG